MTIKLTPTIKLFVTDVDGTLTDGSMYYTVSGEYMKRFNTKDGMGLGMLKDTGIEVAIVTSESSDIALRRAEKLNIDHVYVGVRNKLRQVNLLCSEIGVTLAETAYVGDDLNDLEVMKCVGLSFSVRDANAAVVKLANVNLKTRGGDGAVREAVEWILERQ